MGVPAKMLLRPLREEEHQQLQGVVKATSDRVDVVRRARVLLAVAAGCSFTEAGRQVQMSRHGVTQLVARWNQRGIAVLFLAAGHGRKPTYTPQDRERILHEVRRAPEREADQTATWSLALLQRALRQTDLPAVSRETIRQVLLWCQDEAGPYQTKPQEGATWSLVGHPQQDPHEYVRTGTAKLLTLFRPATGEVRACGVCSRPNAVLHPWLKTELKQALAELNMAESLQRIIVRRTLSGQHPQTPTDIVDWLEQTVRGWNQHPTPFVWNSKRRRRRRERAHLRRLGGSVAATFHGNLFAN